MWIATHKLEPQKSINSDNKALTVQVVALRWKWLFIYPEQHIATVNFVQVPVDTPVEFDLTADDAPMSSFWVPHWGGQLYAMTGMTNKLNLIPTTLGDSTGSSAEINGEGFAGMKFTARASSRQDFDDWVQHVKQVPNVLDMVEYKSLLKPSENNATAFYSTTEADLYDQVLMKYMGSHDHHMGQE
jgi:cytochrome o ubiquinol oxidase subunit 2